VITCDGWGFLEESWLGPQGQAGGLFTKKYRATFLESFWYANGGKYTDRKLILTPDPYFGEVYTGRNDKGEYQYLYIRNVITEARGGAGPNTMITIKFGLPLEDVKLELGKKGKTVKVYGRKDGWAMMDETDLGTGDQVNYKSIPKEEIAKIFPEEKEKSD
jgi:hypothetical protein